MEFDDVQIGQQVRNNVEFAGVPKGTRGVIDEIYDDGFMVAWDLPDRPLPSGYTSYDGRPAIQSGILRDGFNVQCELHLLDRMENDDD